MHRQVHKKHFRKKQSISPLLLTLLVATAVILAAGGLMFSMAKNNQISIARKIDEVKQQIDENNERAELTKVLISRRLDRALMKRQLIAQGSQLRATEPSQFEMILSAPENMPSAMAY